MRFTENLCKYIAKGSTYEYLLVNLQKIFNPSSLNFSSFSTEHNCREYRKESIELMQLNVYQHAYHISGAELYFLRTVDDVNS
jgi:hypothetical protein